MSLTPVTPGSTNNSTQSTLDSLTSAGFDISNAGAVTATDGSLTDVGTLNTVVVTPGSYVTLVSTKSTNIGIADSVSPAGSTVSLEGGIDPDTGEPAAYNVVVGSGDNNISLNDGPSTIQSTTGNDGITSRGGHDTITGGSGKDTIYAGGNSVVTGGTTADSIFGGLFSYSHDTVSAGQSSTINLSSGDNTVYLAGAKGVVHAGVGSDTIFGSTEGPSRDTIFGGGHTTVYAGKNEIIRSTGGDSVFGGDARSTVISSGNDENGKGQLVDDSSGKLHVRVDNTANDSIFGGVGPNGVEHDVSVKISQSSANYDPTKNVQNSDGSTTIHFTNGQTLDVKHVSLTFSDGSNTKFS